jgi:murein DD-endopeptidase MepM/ murein hydrolase activator NlpD
MNNLLKSGNTLSNKVFKEENMKKNFRRELDTKFTSDKIIIYGLLAVGVLTIIVVALLMYEKKINDDVKNSTMTLEQMIAINDDAEMESASSEIGKTVEEVENDEIKNEESDNDIQDEVVNTSINTESLNIENTSSISNETTNSNVQNNNNSQEISSLEENEIKKELAFEKPVEGEIVKEFAKDNLIYSETLQEWTTHLGIDIEADKTSVVKSAESGKIKSIKNDPRYGLTIVTSEFVVEGENVEKGQTIGTVGNTAAFEIADESHLHFEILKDSVQLDPSIYIK